MVFSVLTKASILYGYSYDLSAPCTLVALLTLVWANIRRQRPSTAEALWGVI
jgi:hypothetical protein